MAFLAMKKIVLHLKARCAARSGIGHVCIVIAVHGDMQWQSAMGL